MRTTPYNIVILGAGGIGRAVGLLLAEYADFSCEIHIGDRYRSVAEDAASWVIENSHASAVASFWVDDAFSGDELTRVIGQSDVVLDCLPGSVAPQVAALALKHSKHYVNLTEHVDATEQIVDLAKSASSTFILQTGLAPGFVNVLGYKMFADFCSSNGVEVVDFVGLKVGALTQNGFFPHYYGYTWSPIGVATEYVRDVNIIKDYRKQSVPSLSECESIIIGGELYECDFTSGGAADMPQVLEGRTRRLNYKTIRYPGHYNWVRCILANAPEGVSKADYLDAEMRKTVPVVEEDMVVVYVTIKGNDSSGVLRQVDRSLKIKPTKVGNTTLRAIQATTAAAMAECARLIIGGMPSGVILQHQVDPNSFLDGPFVSRIYFG